VIESLLRRKISQKEIANEIGIEESSLSYEITERTRKGRAYNAEYAHHQAYVREKYIRSRPNTIPLHPRLRETVEKYLLDDQSPELTAKRIKKCHKDLPSVSGVTIRTYIASPYGRKIENHRKKLASKRRRKKKVLSRIKNKRDINKRPKYINEKKTVGHMEGDFIDSGKDGRGMILVHTDRKLRCVFLEKIFPVSIRTLKNGLKRIKKRFPEMKTVTWDNDILLICHRELEKQFGIKIYFCHTHSPWEKPLVENRNKLIRKYIPKGSDISKYSRRFIQKLEEKLQRRIMECLNCRTPGEMLARHRKRKKKLPGFLD
jgi:IS30 family transposase